ncbi:MAG: nitroreductase [Ignavibacteriae bacterium]|nr:MAG: nitroreductase [Ignavibacteriota bacterium]
MKDAKELIYYSSKAPSGHNSQPWKFKIRENTIEIYPDFSYALPIVDPNNRELFISLGTATKNICIASSHFGYECSWEIKKNLENVYYIVIKLHSSKNIVKDKLFQYIEKRQTNRSIYNGKRIDNQILTQLQKLTYKNSVGLYFFQNGEAYFQTIKEAIIKGNKIQMSDSAFKKELLSWIRFNKKEVNNLQNGLTYKVMGSPSTPRFIGETIVKLFLSPEKQNKSDIKKIESSSHFIVLTTKNNTVTEWIMLGITLQNLLLKLTELKIACAYLNPPCELESLSVQLQKQLPVNNEYPSIILRIGYAENVPFSPRKDVEKIIE